MKINITQHHIDKANYLATTSGERASLSCPIALAIRQTYPHAAVAGVCLFTEDGDDSTRINLPLVAREFINAYDHGKKVVPFEFELDFNNTNLDY